MTRFFVGNTDKWNLEEIEAVVISKGYKLQEITKTTEFHAYVTVTKSTKRTLQFRITRNHLNCRGEWLKMDSKGIYQHVSCIR